MAEEGLQNTAMTLARASSVANKGIGRVNAPTIIVDRWNLSLQIGCATIRLATMGPRVVMM
jgi:hypothetical protein